MRIFRAGRGAITTLGVGLIALCGSQQALAQVKLQYKFPEGKTLRYKTTTNHFQVTPLMGMEIQSRENKTVVWTQTIGKRRKDSSLPVEVKIESLRANLRLQGGINLTFDSAKPDAKPADPDLAPLADLYKFESQAAYTVVLDDHDKVKAIEGAEKFLESAGRLDAIAREQLRGSIEADRLRTQFEQEHRNLPDGPVKAGESWERTEITDFGGQAFSFRKKYEYVGTEKKADKTLDKIGSKVLEVKCQQDQTSHSPVKVTKSDLKVDSSEGTLLFDREEGCVVEARERTQIKGSVSYAAQGSDQTVQLDLRLQANVQLQPATK
jgi:hypothetical protein